VWSTSVVVVCTLPVELDVGVSLAQRIDVRRAQRADVAAEDEHGDGSDARLPARIAAAKPLDELPFCVRNVVSRLRRASIPSEHFQLFITLLGFDDYA
jgi:hypothetical protein